MVGIGPTESLPDEPATLLPPDSMWRLEEYLDMLAAVGDRTRFEIVYRLVHGGPTSPTELEELIEVDDSTLHYHLNALLDVGLIEKRKRTERGQECLYSYYRPTVFGEVVLTEGIEDLIRGEQEFEELYSDS